METAVSAVTWEVRMSARPQPRAVVVADVVSGPARAGREQPARVVRAEASDLQPAAVRPAVAAQAVAARQAVAEVLPEAAAELLAEAEHRPAVVAERVVVAGAALEAKSRIT
jgi:hypothetical protein